MKYQSDQTCRFCLDPESILTPTTSCTGCSKLPKEISSIMQTEFKLAKKLRDFLKLDK